MHSGRDATTSMTECCFMKTVEMLINTQHATLTMRQPVLENRGVYHSAYIAANEPITCSEGQTFVSVSKV